MWKSNGKPILRLRFRFETVYPNIGTDSYPNLMNSPLEQPMRHALTLQSDPTFVTGWARATSCPTTYRRSAESLEAHGFDR